MKHPRNTQTQEASVGGAATATAQEPSMDGPAQPEKPKEQPKLSLTYSIVDFAEVPAFDSGPRRKYAALEAALRELPEGKALTLPVPDGVEVDKFVPKMVSTIRNAVPRTRSRTHNGVIYLWVGEPMRRKAQRKGGK